MIEIAPGIAIDERELEERFVRAPGPGGQHVNKVSTAVELRFDLGRAPLLPETVLARLRRLAGRRLNAEGILTIEAHRFRTRTLPLLAGGGLLLLGLIALGATQVIRRGRRREAERHVQRWRDRLQRAAAKQPPDDT